MYKIVLALVALLTLTVIAAGAIFYWSSQKKSNSQEQALEKAEDLLQQEQYTECRSVVLYFSPRSPEDSELRSRWNKLERSLAIKTRDISLMAGLYESKPKVISEDEEASLLMIRVLKSFNREPELARLRDSWRGREQRPDDWFLLDADMIGAAEGREAAIEHLKSRKLESKMDALRLMRLAIMHANDPKASVKYLQEAFEADSTNSDVRLFRGQILERSANYKLAQAEYAAAVLSSPRNPLYIDQLAEFYLRRGQYELAVQTFTDASHSGLANYFAIKAAFWEKVSMKSEKSVLPLTNLPHEQVINETTTEFCEYLINLEEEKLWSEEAFGLLRFSGSLKRERQETFWLSLIQNLKEGNETKALEQLRSNRFQQGSYNSALQESLQAILQYRLEEQLPYRDSLNVTGSTENVHVFVQEMLKWCDQPEEYEQAQGDFLSFVKSPYIFSAAFLAAGWRESALILLPKEADHQATPDWFLYGIGQCFRTNRTDEVALEWLGNPTLSAPKLLKAEILASEGKWTSAIPLFRQVLNSEISDDPLKIKAGWVISLFYLEQNKIGEVVALLEVNPVFKESVRGKETHAKVALAQGDNDLALELYQSIEGRSTEAKAYIARYKMDQGKIEESLERINDLSMNSPNNMGLRNTLNRVQEETVSN